MLRRIRPLRLLCLPTILLASCGGDSGTSPGVPSAPSYSVLGEAEIGPAGGVLAAGGVEVAVPAGSFAANATLTLLCSTTDHPLGGDGDGKTFRLDGIPGAFAAPIAIRFDPESPIGGDPLVAVGMRGRIPSADEEAVGYGAVEAANEQDTALVFSLQPPAAGAAGERTKTGAAAEPAVLDVIFLYLVGFDSYYSEHGRFHVAFPSGVTAQQAASLGGMLEEAWSAFSTPGGLGFSCENRTMLPIAVLISELKSTVYGYSYIFPHDYNAGLLQFNKLNLGATDDLRRTAFHEFFHLVQSWQYPAGAITIKKYDWLDEACAVWCEGPLTGDPSYVSPIRDGNEYEPFWGLANESFSGARNHGYGMSGLVEYLVDTYDRALVREFYDGVRMDKSPADCVIDAVAPFDQPSVWWAEFLTAYAGGQVYADMVPGDIATTLVTSAERFRVQTATDTLRTFTRSYLDLSGRVFRVDLDRPAFDEGSVVNLSLAGDDGAGRIAAWSYGSGPLAVLGGPTAGSLQVGGLPALKAADRDLLVLVANTRGIAPYTTARDISLTVRVTGAHKVFGLTRLDAVISNVRRNMVCAGGGCASTAWTTYEALHIRDVEGSWTGATFSGSWNRHFGPGAPDGGERTEAGTLTLTLAADGSAVVSIAADQTITYADGDVERFGFSREDAVTAIPEIFELYGYEAGYRLTDPAVCANLQLAYSYDYGTIDALVTLQSFDCSGISSVIGVFFEQ